MKAKDIVAKMTREEKAAMLSGSDFWRLNPVERLDVPKTMVCDGPHGLRKQDDKADHLGVNESIIAVCFPTAVGATSSFNRKLMRELGETLGEECQAENVSVLLGPAVNIKRSPLCGRNFEYMSEDPYLTGEMAVNYINGVQSKNVGVSMKHFAVNNQEKRRSTINAVVDERALREIYLSAFEAAVKRAQPWTLMCSYNKINGVYSSENKRLLTDILRDEWGFQGYVMSDWGAVCGRAKGVKAGLDLEMPSSRGYGTKKILAALEDGSLKEEDVDRSAGRIVSKILQFTKNRDKSARFDREEDHKKARVAAGESMVLLKNNGVLPLKKDKTQKVAFIGGFAADPRYQGGGSSHINSYKVVGALEAVKAIKEVAYEKGFSTQNEPYSKKKAQKALNLAKSADVAVVFAGLPDTMESEGFDRSHLDLPECQNRLIEEICAVQPNTVVVLHNGSPVLMPWLENVAAVLESYLGGEACGEAQVDILFGDVNPSAKLAETFPCSLADTPCFKNFPGHLLSVDYKESIFVGYRYYDKAKKEVLFPFGHGLSYTKFEYGNLKIDKAEIEAGDAVTVSFTVKNVGAREGAEVAQVYVFAPEKKAFKAPKELKGFEKVFLKAGEEKEVTVTLDARAFAFYNTKKSDWDFENGSHRIFVGASSRDMRLEGAVNVICKDESVVYEKSQYAPYYSGDVQDVSDADFERLLGFKLPARELPKDHIFTLENTFEQAKDTKWGGRIVRLMKAVLGRLGNNIFPKGSLYHMAIEGTMFASITMTGFSEEQAQCIINMFNNQKPVRSLMKFIGGFLKKKK